MEKLELLLKKLKSRNVSINTKKYKIKFTMTSYNTSSKRDEETILCIRLFDQTGCGINNHLCVLQCYLVSGNYLDFVDHFNFIKTALFSQNQDSEDDPWDSSSSDSDESYDKFDSI
jgi:hypothetical protein